eukprot:1367991-Prymnesium_polylepis.1
MEPTRRRRRGLGGAGALLGREPRPRVAAWAVCAKRARDGGRCLRAGVVQLARTVQREAGLEERRSGHVRVRRPATRAELRAPAAEAAAGGDRHALRRRLALPAGGRPRRDVLGLFSAASAPPRLAVSLRQQGEHDHADRLLFALAREPLRSDRSGGAGPDVRRAHRGGQRRHPGVAGGHASARRGDAEDDERGER